MNKPTLEIPAPSPEVVAQYFHEWLQTPTRFAQLLQAVHDDFNVLFEEVVEDWGTCVLDDGTSYDAGCVYLVVRDSEDTQKVINFCDHVRRLAEIHKKVTEHIARSKTELFLGDGDLLWGLASSLRAAKRAKLSNVSLRDVQRSFNTFWLKAQDVAERILIDAGHDACNVQDVSTDSGSDVPPWKDKSKKTNDQLLAFLSAVKLGATEYQNESVLYDWPLKKFAEEIDRATGTIAETPAWTFIQKERATRKQEQSDRLRKN